MFVSVVSMLKGILRLRPPSPLLVLGILAAIVGASGFLARTTLVFVYPYTIDYGEGLLLNFAQLWHQYGTYFFDIQQLPYIHGTYPPVIPVLLAPFSNWPLAQLMVGRGISVLATVVLLVAMYRLYRFFGLDRSWAAVFAGLLLGLFPVAYFGSVLKVDMLAVALSTAGLAVYVLEGERKSLRRFVGPLLWVIAFFTKHNTVVAPLAIMLWLATRRQWRELAQVFAWYVVPIGVLLGFGQWHTEGELFHHLFTYTAFLPLDLNQGVLFWYYFWRFTIGAVALAVIGFMSSVPSWLRWYAMASLVTLISSAKPGADFNYFIEPAVAIFLLAGAAYQAVGLTQSSTLYWRVAAHISFILQSALIIWLVASLGMQRNPLARLSEDQRTAYYVRTATGPILAEEWGPVVLAGRPAFYESFQFRELARYDLWDDEEFIDSCNRGAFSLVIAGSRLQSTPRVATCLVQSYEIIETTAHYKYYRPRSLPSD